MAENDSIWHIVGEIAGYVALTAAAASITNALSGKTTGIAQSTYALKQSRPPTTNLVGDYRRVSGAFVLYDVDRSVFCFIQAINKGRVDSIARYWLNDDEVSIVPGNGRINGIIDGTDDGRYVDDRMIIKYRLGAATETKYTDVELQRFNYYWDDPNFRGDDTASVLTVLRAPESKWQGQAFPNGKTETSVAARAVCYDWRDVTQSRTNKATWKWSANPVVWGVHKEWTEWGLDWDTQIAPVLSDLTAEANICDEPVALKGGGTEPRYRVAGWYYGDTPEATVRENIRAAMDGFWTLDGLGRLVIKCGHYEEPDVTIPAEAIEEWTWERGTPEEKTVRQLNVSFVSPKHKFTDVEADPWLVDKDGLKDDDLKLEWVCWLSQARRLAKRKAARLLPGYSGQIQLGPWGAFLFHERYLKMPAVFPDEPTMAGAVLEVVGAPELDPETGRVVFDVILANPAIDAWNASTEEGGGLEDTSGVVTGGLPQPTITSVTAVNDSNGSTTGVRLSIVAGGPSRTDISWVIRWRITGTSVWTEESYTSITGGSPSIKSGFVVAASSVDVEVAYRTGLPEQSEWSETTTVNTTVTETAPSAPTALSLSSPSAGSIIAAVTQSSSTNAAYVKIYRGTTSTFADAVQVMSLLASPSQAISYVMSGLSAGTYYVWAVAATVNGTASTPTGPQSITIT